MENLKPSQIIQEFLSYLEKCKDDYEMANRIMENEDKRVQDFLHAMEFAQNKNERNRIATQLHNSRIKRRNAKDKLLEVEKVYKFYKDPSNVPMLKKLKNLVKDQIKTEEYLAGERHYNPRGGDLNN